MFRLYDEGRWPNNMDFRARGGIGSTQGLSPFSGAEIARRHELVRAKLRELDLDILMVQCSFMPTVMAVNTRVVWLTGCTGYRNAVTLILPRDGELAAIAGRKPSSNPGWITPFTGGEDMSPHLAGVKRIGYVDTGYLSLQFSAYLESVCPGVEIVDFTRELEHMMAVKSPEELAAMEDACQLQNRCWAAAPTVVRPGRLVGEIRNDLLHLLLDMGMDPTLMAKILLFVRPNRPQRPEDGPHFTDRDYVLKPTDYITLCFETPGSGGYYTERSRHFFFDEPHPRLRELWGEVLELHAFQNSLYKPGVTMEALRREINRYKAERGYATEGEIRDWTPLADWTPEIRGMGILTVDRPQIQLEWEDMALTPGMVFCTMPGVKVGHEDMKLFEMTAITETGYTDFAPYPLDLTVL